MDVKLKLLHGGRDAIENEIFKLLIHDPQMTEMEFQQLLCKLDNQGSLYAVPPEEKPKGRDELDDAAVKGFDK